MANTTDSSPPPLAPTPAVLAAFAFVDALLDDSDRALAANVDHGLGRRPWLPQGALRNKIAELIAGNFALGRWDCQVSSELDAFRLYHEDDISDALSAAYCRHKAGKDPMEAFTADYSIRHGGILSWLGPEELNEGSCMRPPDGEFRAAMRRHRRGDRFLSFSLPTLFGLMLVRGDRLVWEYTLVHMNNGGGPDHQHQAAFDRFNRRGGYPAFFAGTLRPEGEDADEFAEILRNLPPPSGLCDVF